LWLFQSAEPIDAAVGGDAFQGSLRGFSDTFESTTGGESFVAVVAVAVAILMALKTLATVNATRWAMRDGAAYAREESRRAKRSTRPRSAKAIAALVRKHNGDFFPFGAKDYRLRSAIGQQVGDSRTVMIGRTALRVLRPLLFNARGLAIGAIALAILANATGSGTPVVLNAMALVLMAMTIALAIESLVWYINVGAYSQPYHRQLVAARSAQPGASLSDEFAMYLQIVGFNVGAAVVACSLAQTTLASFGATISASPGAANEAERLATFAHFVLSDYVTTGDSGVSPQDPYGHFLASVITIQGLVLVVFVFSVLLSIMSARRAR
jgi:hypothetical protein